MALLETRNATKRFGGLTAVSDLTFDLEEGAIVSVIGPNGAGKTTFFNCIAGFYQIDEGSITLDGTEIHDLRPDKIARLGLSRTYQNIRLFGGMTAAENVLVGQHQHLRVELVPGGPAHTLAARGGDGRARGVEPSAGVRGAQGCGRRAGQQHALRRPAPPGDRPRPGHQPAASCCSTSRPPA